MYVLTIVNTDFCSFSLSFFLLHSLLLTHFGDTQEADFFLPSYFGITRMNKKNHFLIYVFLHKRMTSVRSWKGWRGSITSCVADYLDERKVITNKFVCIYNIYSAASSIGD